MSDRIISRADLSEIERSLGAVDRRLSVISSDQDHLADELAQLRTDFAAFVAEDARHKELQLAETRLVKVRQEIEERFGFYGEVRRRATGIVQALDAGIVTHQTVQGATEDMMISAPGYWLAPALVGLAAWIRDERDLAEKAVAEAVRRDDYKTALYFALVLRRYERRTAAAAWLGRFYAHQDPTALDREFVVLLDAVAGGIFGPEARAITRQHTAQWLQDLSQRAGFVSEQERRWAVALDALTPSALTHAGYPTLERYSPTWPAYRASLLSAHLHARVREYFADIFEGELAPSPRLRDEVDRLLARLVTEYDAEELPLRSREREMQIIVDENGDLQAARRRMAAEKEAFDEKSDFTQLLTNAAMHPESSGATRGTQRYAVALSRDWVVAAYERVTANARAAVPAELVLEVEGWRGAVRDGSEEQTLVQSLGAFFQEKESAEMDASRSMGAQIAIGLGIVAGVWGLIGGFNVLLLVIGAALVVFGIVSLNGRESTRAQIRARYAALRAEGERIVKAAVAEAVDARAELLREDARAEETRALLLAISPDQYTLSREAEPRAVLA